jgi:hypothetical protein
MIVFGAPKRFCAASQVAVALKVIRVVTSTMRTAFVNEILLHCSLKELLSDA